jgi:hypothetical protein
MERLRNTPIHLCRLRYRGDEEHWGFAFFAYSSEKYELSVFPSGQFFGPPEDAFEVSANVHLQWVAVGGTRRRDVNEAAALLKFHQAHARDRGSRVVSTVEELSAIAGDFGFGIGRLRSTSQAVATLRHEL